MRGRRYRSGLEIIMDILCVARKGAKRTQIMYQANLSYKLLCKYLTQVQDIGLLSLDDADGYRVTSKGREFLNRLGEYFKHCERLEVNLSELSEEEMTLEKMVGADLNNRRNRRLVISELP